MSMKTCKNCQLTKTPDQFYKSSDRSCLRSVCKPCYMIKYPSKPSRKTKEERAAYAREYRAKNPTYTKEYRAKNLAKMRELTNKSSKLWRERYPHKDLAKKAAYKAAKANAVPKWLSKEQKQEIINIYKTCPKGWHVDHIVPLRGKEVRGLHVPWNLQHLPAQQNLAKRNRLEG